MRLQLKEKRAGLDRLNCSLLLEFAMTTDRTDLP